MNKYDYQPNILRSGEVRVYDFGNIKIHNYNSNDALKDQVIIVEQNKNAVVIENPSFVRSGRELKKYLRSQKLNVTAKILSYHWAGARFLPEVPAFSTAKADQYGRNGNGSVMVARFSNIFGKKFDSNINPVTNIIKAGRNHIGGIEFNIIETEDAFDIEIPDANVIYTHMLGADAHSIVPSLTNLDTMIERLTKYYERGYALVLSTHHTPENNDDIRTKIDYLHGLDKAVSSSQTAEDLKLAMHIRYPECDRVDCLDITANWLIRS
ncbi:MAG: hypothetical protein LBL08_03825 [Candidatus Nomurabacteria bacterium]|jgi:hypothetical protein|nr:hypothetical protein [Candidatus Nomurabacteria bacterium]